MGTTRMVVIALTGMRIASACVPRATRSRLRVRVCRTYLSQRGATDPCTDSNRPARPGLEAAAWARLDAAWASDIQGPSPSPQAGLQARASGLGPGLKYIFPRLRSWGRHRQFHSYAKREIIVWFRGVRPRHREETLKHTTSSDLIRPPGPGLGARLGLQNVEARALSPPRPNTGTAHELNLDDAPHVRASHQMPHVAVGGVRPLRRHRRPLVTVGHRGILFVAGRQLSVLTYLIPMGAGDAHPSIQILLSAASRPRGAFMQTMMTDRHRTVPS
ncbi:hypothetical protein B0H17DRAFT_1129925 [Mycena rosella]|uniref:Secreted protein n=1 Tax=Mycena rosella TaxID=1033263 RepID=A0AAD7GJV1_MYCRO|nr:hypothetical protein B0H17DRAFT_1129925 [Mycena rosella]